jgi:hypothetical protein
VFMATSNAFENEQAPEMAAKIAQGIAEKIVDWQNKNPTVIFSVNGVKHITERFIKSGLIRAYASGKRDENQRVCNVIENL